MAARVALALLGMAAGASALVSVPAPGTPCSTVFPGSPGYAQCDPTLQPADYYTHMRTGTLSLANLGADTNGGACCLVAALCLCVACSRARSRMRSLWWQAATSLRMLSRRRSAARR